MGLAPEVWKRHLLPLPHEIDFGQPVECCPADVVVRMRSGAGLVERHAADELRDFLDRYRGGGPCGDAFPIVLGIPDSEGQLEGEGVDVARLQILPNKGQAYLIAPRLERGLNLVALEEQGIYYAAQTLLQLLAPTISTERISIPRVWVVDWPDLDERGLWNFPDEAAWIPWLASVKLNYGKMANTRLAPVERDRPNSADIDSELMTAAAKRAFNYVPYILHLNFLHEVGLFRAYPELAGVGEGALTGRYVAHKRGNQHRVPCASQPRLVKILGEWMQSIAAQGAKDISCWLSERPGQCGCSACTAVGQFVLEARAFVAAWEKLRIRNSGLGIRIFLSTTSTERDHRVLAELPTEVKIERACATDIEQVLHSPRDLMANPLFDSYSGEGRWIATYDVPIGAYGKVETPEFKLPERSAHRVRDYVLQVVRRQYSGAYGMIAWGTLAREINGFNIEALAEWSWNAQGRDEWEFAIAWAVRQGFDDPERVADWAGLVGPVEFDVYASDFPTCYSWGKAVDMVRQRRRPYLGEGMFRYYSDEADFDRKAEICREAMQIAEGLEDPDFANETRVVASYVDLARWIWKVAEHIATKNLRSLSEQEVLKDYCVCLDRAGIATCDSIRVWRGGLGPEPWNIRVHDAIDAVEKTATEIVAHIRDSYLY